MHDEPRWTIERDMHFHPILRVPLAILGSLGFGSLLVSLLPFISAALVHVLEGAGFLFLGLAGVIFFGYSWWHRLPVKIQGGLSPDRPFFYHLGSALLIGICLILVAAGVSSIRSGWG